LEILLSTEDYYENPLWHILVETVHSMIMYQSHKAYVRDVMLYERAHLSPKDLVLKLGITLGEALVIVNELQMERDIKKENDKSFNEGLKNDQQ